MNRTTTKAIMCTQNGQNFYITSISSKYLKEMCFVSRKREEPVKGFQRLLNPKRAKDIADYLDTNKGSIPTAVIVSAQDKAKLKYDKKNMDLSFEVLAESFLVIDGQHRLYGLFEAKNIYDIPVIIFDNLNSSQEIRLFIDINTTQKGVPSALLLDIKAPAGTETKLEERQRKLFDKLNENSVMAGFLSPNESKAGKITRTAFNACTAQIFQDGIISDMGDDIIYKTTKNYLAAIKRNFDLSENKDARLNKTVIFKSVLNAFNEVCEKCLLKYQNLKIETLEEYLEPLQKLPFSEYLGTNKATEAKILNDIRSFLKEPVTMSEDMF